MLVPSLQIEMYEILSYISIMPSGNETVIHFKEISLTKSKWEGKQKRKNMKWKQDNKGTWWNLSENARTG